METITSTRSDTPKAIMSFVFMVLLVYYKMKLIVYMIYAMLFALICNNEGLLLVSICVCIMDLLIPEP